MKNKDTRAAWSYHNGTKHPGGYLLDPYHTFDPRNRPTPFKIYADLEPIPLALDPSPAGGAALSAISSSSFRVDGERIPDIGALTRVLYFSAGITKVLRLSWGEYAFRAAACTGALYHIELYVVCGDLPGLEAGVYHFNPGDTPLNPPLPGGDYRGVLTKLRQGDYRRVLVDASGDEPSVASAPAIIVYTDVIWRNAVKYQTREYRHAFWDCGTILANTLAVASAHEMPSRVVAGFVDESVNRLLGLDTQREMALALVPLGHAKVGAGFKPAPTGSSPQVAPLSLRTAPISKHEIDFPAIREMHEASSLITRDEVASWRGQTPAMAMPAPEGRLFPLQPAKGDALPQDPVEQVIVRRGSTRQFERAPITFEQLSTAIERATRGVPADFLEPPGATLNHVYLIVSDVDGLPAGVYAFHRDLRALELLKEGDFRDEAGHLGLDQELPADASVNIYFLTDLRPVLERFGNRGYRAAQLDASITAGRLYLAAYAQRFGATGLTFYDDEVTDFFSPHAHGKSVTFLLALGKRARRG
jgi:SagB-type dehydrogenase family enzyme